MNHVIEECTEVRSVSSRLSEAARAKIPREWEVRPILKPEEATWAELGQILERLTKPDAKLTPKDERQSKGVPC